MPGRNHPIPRHRNTAAHDAGALPAQPAIAEVEQEVSRPLYEAVVVKHDGPQTVHQLPAKRAATQTVIVGTPAAGQETVIGGGDFKRKRTVLCAVDNAFYYATTPRALSTTSVTAAAVWPANVPLVLENCDAVYLACAGISGATSSEIGIVTEYWAD
jgi:hypothetical protein